MWILSLIVFFRMYLIISVKFFFFLLPTCSRKQKHGIPPLSTNELERERIIVDECTDWDNCHFSV